MTINLYNPRSMGRAVERIPRTKTFLRDTLFSGKETFPTKSIDVDFTKGSRRLAPFVHERIGSKIIENTGYETNTFTPPLIAPDMIITTDDIMQRSIGELLYGGISSEEREDKKMIDNLKKLNDMITRREEWMCAQALFTGKIPIKGEGIDYEIDFRFTNKEIKSNEELWSEPSSNPIMQLTEMRKVVQKNGMVNPNICIMASDVADIFIRNHNVMQALNIRNIELARINPRELPSGATYIGTIPMLGIDIYTYDEWFVDDWTNPEIPENKPLIPDGYIGLFSTEVEFFMAYGGITLLNTKTGEFTMVENERVPDTYIEKHPDRRILQLNSRPLPCPIEVNSWYIAKVI